MRLSFTSGDFDIADLGKVLSVPGTASSWGTRTMYGWISQLTDSTHIRVENAAGEVKFADVTGAWGPTTATVGQNEPDSNYMVFPMCNKGENFSLIEPTTRRRP